MKEFIDKIILGDSYKVIKEIPDKSIDCIYTDIPYLYNSGGAGKSELCAQISKVKLELMGADRSFFEDKENQNSKGIREQYNKIKENDEIINLEGGIDYAILDDFVRVMKKINIFIWCSKLQLLDLMKYFIEEKGCYFELLTWHKTNPIPAVNNSWSPDTEYCLYFREKGVPLNNGIEHKGKFYVSPLNSEDKKLYLHPTIKPLEFVKTNLLHATKEGQIILDPFCGSGTTCVACKELGRHYVGIELNKEYYDIAKDRINGIDQIQRKALNEGQIMFDL